MIEELEVGTELNLVEVDLNAWLESIELGCEDGELLLGGAMLAMEEGCRRRMELGLQTRDVMWNKRAELSHDDWVACNLPSTQLMLEVYDLFAHTRTCTRCHRGRLKPFHSYELAAILNNLRELN